MADKGILGNEVLGDGVLGTFESDSGSTTLLPSLYTNTQTFNTNTEKLTLAPALFTNTQTFYTHTEKLTITPSLITNTQTFNTHTQKLTTTPSLYTNTQSFNTHLEKLTIFPSLLSDGEVFYSPTVAPDGDYLYPPLLTNSQTFNTHIIQTSRMYASLYTNSQSFNTHKQTFGLAPSLITQTITFQSAAVSFGIRPSLLTLSQSFPTALETLIIHDDLLVNNQIFYTHAISIDITGSATILAENNTSAAQAYQNLRGVGYTLIAAFLCESLGTVASATITGTANLTMEDFIAETPVNYLNNLKNHVINSIEDDYEDLEDCLDQIVRRAELRIFRDTRGAVGFRKYSSGSLTQEVVIQDIVPSEAKSVLGLRVKKTTDTRYYNLKSRDESYINKLNLTLASNRPEFYCVTSNDAYEPIIIVAPKPASNDNYKLEYRVLNSIVDNPTGTWLAERAYDLLVSGTMVEALLYIKADMTEVKTALEGYTERLKAFLRQQVKAAHGTEYRQSGDLQ